MIFKLTLFLVAYRYKGTFKLFPSNNITATPYLTYI